MAEKTKLNYAKRENGSVVVTWIDAQGLGMYPGWTKLGLWTWGGIFLVLLITSGENPDIVGHFSGFIIISLAAVGISFFSLRIQRQVTFTKDTISFDGNKVPTQEVTRFDYGSRSQLTGEKPHADPDPRIEWSDPILIRLWQNDSKAHQVAINLWNLESNHEIRDALSKALADVQQAEKQAAHEVEFGKANDFGVPEY